MVKPISVLLITPSVIDQGRTQLWLAQQPDVELHTADSVDAALSLVHNQGFDCVVLDSAAVRRFALESSTLPPLVLLTGTDADEVILEQAVERAHHQRDLENLNANLEAVQSQLELRVGTRTRELLLREHELGQRNRELEALNSIAIGSTFHQDIRSILDNALDRLSSLVPHDGACLMMLDGSRLIVLRDMHERRRLALEQADPNDLPLIQHISRTRQPLIVPEVPKEPRWVPLDPESPINSWLGIPLTVQNQVLGVLSLDKNEPNFYHENHISVLARVAPQVALVLENVTLVRRLEERNLELETLNNIALLISAHTDLAQIVDPLLDELLKFVPADSASLIFVDNSSLMALRNVSPAREARMRAIDVRAMPLANEMLRTMQPLLISDVHVDPRWQRWDMANTPHAYLGIPFIFHGELYGMLTLLKNEPGFYTRTHAESLMRLLRQVSVALENARLMRRVDERSRILEVIDRLIVAVSSSDDLQSALEAMLDQIQKAIPYDSAGLFLSGDSGEQIFATRGLSPAVAQALRQQPSVLTDLTSMLTEQSQPVIINDVTQDARWKAIDGEKIRSWMGIPLIYHERLSGLLTLDKREPNYFTDAHVQQLASIAPQLAMVIEHARLIKHFQARNHELEVLNAIALNVARAPDLEQGMRTVLEQLARLVPHDSASLILFDQEKILFYATRNVPTFDPKVLERMTHVGKPLHREMLNARQPIIIGDVLQDQRWFVLPEYNLIRSWMGTPLIFRDRVLGVLNLDKHEPDFFTPQHAEQVMRVCSQIAAVIESTRLFKSLEQRNLELDVLNTIAIALARDPDLDKGMLVVLEQLERLVPHDSASLVLFYGGRVVLASTRNLPGVSQHILEEPDGYDNRLLREVITGKQPIVIDDVELDARWTHLMGGERIRGWLGVPLIYRDEVLGVLNIDKHEPHFFTPQHAQQAWRVCTQIAVVIENARLLRDLERRVEDRTAQLAAERAQLQIILERMGDAVLYVSQLTVHYVNRRFTELTGFTLEALRADPRGIYQILLTNAGAYEERRTEIANAVMRGEMWQRDFPMIRADGSAFDARLIISGVSGTDGTITGLIALIRDVSQEKALQAQKDRFISTASHELRNPLQLLNNRLFLMRRKPDAMTEHMEALERISDTMNRLVEDLLDVSRFERGVITLRIERIQLDAIVSDLVDLHIPEAEQRGTSLVYLPSPVPLWVDADVGRIRQVITNLLVNALNYTPSGGLIRVKVVGQGGEVRVSVRDTGVGIPPDLKERIFEPFFRVGDSAVRGTGLGLSIAREIVEMLGGTITVESTVGSGSEFTVTLKTTS